MNLLRSGTEADIHERLKEAAAHGPTAWTEHGVLYVLTYAEVERLAHDPRVAGVGRNFLEYSGVTSGPLHEWFGELMFTTEGATHTRLRRVVQRWFTPKSVERQRRFATEAVALRLAALCEDRRGDLCEALLDVPATVMCRVLGIPAGRVSEVISISDAVSPAFGFIRPDQVQDAEAAAQQLHTLTKEIIDSLTLDENDLIWGLLQELTERETIVMVGTLLFGGHDTTSSQIACSLQLLLDHPATFAQIRNGELDPLDAASETLRMQPSIMVIPRTLTAGIETDGMSIPAGTLVMLATGATSREPAIWGDPDVFRPSRFTEPGCAKVQTFGAGAHYCLGTALAKMVIAETIRGVADVAEGMEAVEASADVAWSTVLARRPERVLVCW